jgi:hypothetical protein
VIVINTSFKLAPWADVLYACDWQFWDYHKPEIDRIFEGQFWTQDSRAQLRHGIMKIGGKHDPGLGRGEVIHFGGNSGYQCINLAYLWGAKKIVLLGFDMKRGPQGQSHWHGDHPRPLSTGLPLDKWLVAFDQLAVDLVDEGVPVINATRDTALQCFDKLPLERALR